MIIFLEKNKDYKYYFPYGPHGIPQIKILKGKHKGLVFNIESSVVVNSIFENKLNVSYKVLKFPEDKSVVTSPEFICHATYNFIRDFNAHVAKGK